MRISAFHWVLQWRCCCGLGESLVNRRFEPYVDPFADPFAGIAHETVTHYWGNFHAGNLLLIPVKPNVYQVTHGKEALNLIAEGLEYDWPFAELKQVG